MRCPKQSLAGEAEAEQTQLLPQQLGGPDAFWPPYSPQPGYNSWMAYNYPVAPGPMQSPFQVLPQTLTLGEPSVWFEGLVTAVSKKIKDNEKKGAGADVDKKNAEPGNLSVEQEKALADALTKQKKGKVTMEQAFRELSQMYGHTQLEWKTWFFSNYERLISKVDSNFTPGRASVDNLGSAGFVNPVASRTRSATINRPSSCSAKVSIAETPTDSHEESESESESESASEWEGSSTLNEESSTPAHQSDESLTPRNAAPHLRVRNQTRCSTKTKTLHQTSWGTRAYAPVTEEDLRAMARYRWEKGDDYKTSRYFKSRWREFAERPENHKRSLDAWHCVPRSPGHAAAIDRYVREYQLRADIAESKPILPVLSPTRKHDGSQAESSLGERRQFGIPDNTLQREKLEDRTSASRAMGQVEIIDLTDEKEE